MSMEKAHNTRNFCLICDSLYSIGETDPTSQQLFVICSQGRSLLSSTLVSGFTPLQCHQYLSLLLVSKPHLVVLKASALTLSYLSALMPITLKHTPLLQDWMTEEKTLFFHSALQYNYFPKQYFLWFSRLKKAVIWEPERMHVGVKLGICVTCRQLTPVQFNPWHHIWYQLREVTSALGQLWGRSDYLQALHRTAEKRSHESP